MIRIITDPSVETTLIGVTETAEIRTANGDLLGYFCPASPESARVYAAAVAMIPPDEVARRKQAGKAASPTADVLERLRKLAD